MDGGRTDPTNPRWLRPDRPKLADALAAVTTAPREVWAECLLTEPGPWRLLATAAGIEVHWGDRGAWGLSDAPGEVSVRWSEDGSPGLYPWTIRDPGEAWEALAARGLIPAAWVDDPARRFIDGPGARDVLASQPTDVLAAVALAADAGGIARAEALAVELTARLAVWGSPRPRRVAWRVLPWAEWREEPYLGPSWLNVVRTQAMFTAWLPATANHPADSEWEMYWDKDPVGWVVWAAETWSEVLGEAPNALQPLVDLWATGYALDTITDDAVVLVCPALESDG